MAILSKSIHTAFVSKRMMSGFSDPVQVRAKERLWKNVFFYFFCPLLVLGHLNVYYLKKHEKPHNPDEIKPYSYMHRINKPFWWGDGKTPLFSHKHDEH